MKKATNLTKTGLAEMLKGGVIMDVVDAEQAKIAEASGACAVMALERVPAQIRREGGVARASDVPRDRCSGKSAASFRRTSWRTLPPSSRGSAV